MTYLRLGGVLFAALLVAAGCRQTTSPDDELVVTPTVGTLETVCENDVPVVAPILTGDFPAAIQNTINCMSWQTFIALNWPSDPNKPGQPDMSVSAAQWGAPDDLRPTVWESYSASPDIFRADAASPLPFGQAGPLPPNCPSGADLKLLVQDAKFSSEIHTQLVATGVLVAQDDLELDSVLEATGQGLTDQSGNPVHFERRVNEDEYTYIVTNQLYDAEAQTAFARGSGISLPAGKGGTVDEGGVIGAIEIKAAWRILPDSNQSIWPRYKKSLAFIIQHDGSCTGPHTVGLVGLHIIHKTETFGNFVWATFEQIDNAPDRNGDTTHPVNWTFFDPGCTDPCTPSYTDPPPPGTVSSTPVQVERMFALAGGIPKLNATVQKTITDANAESVWQYYEQVDSLWDQNPGSVDPGPGAMVALPFNTVRMNGVTVANTTMETYIQGRSCSFCHTAAHAAPTLDGDGIRVDSRLATDYSFLFSTACLPNQPCPLPSSED